MFDDFFEILAEDNELIIIRKSILKICDDDMIATAILSKSIYYSKISKFDDRRFYKFKEPCSETCGDSWCEVLGLKNKYKFDKALTILKNKNFIKTKIDMNRKTYYFLNFAEIQKAIINNNTLINERKRPLKAKTELKEGKETTEQEKTLKTQGNAKFEKPSLDELKKYAYVAGLKVDCERFYDYYESNGWLVGNKAKMRDWKASLRNWARNESKFGLSNNQNANKTLTQRLNEQEARILAKYEKRQSENQTQMLENSEAIECEILGA